jgi:hypothetical protein
MAKKSGGSSKSSSSEPSNTGLIVTLVFFILATIGLGVGTYMGFGAKADAVKEAKTAADKATASDKKADEAEARRIAVKIAAGVADAAERARFGTLKGSSGGPIAGDVAGLYTQFQSQLNLTNAALPAWNPATGDQPPKTLLVLADDLQKSAAAAVAKEKAVQDELTKERESFKADLSESQTKLKTAQDSLAKANADLLAEQKTRAGGSDQKDADIKKLSEDLAALTIELQNTITDKNREIKKMREESETSKKVRQQLAEKYGPLLEKLDQVRLARPELHDLAELQDLMTKALEGQQSLVNDTPKGAIVETKPGQVFINLGSADNVHTGLTFSVLPSGSTGKAAAATPRKAAVEVVAIMGPHLSAAKIVESANQARDPLLRGDLLFNPAWDPSQHVHVALVGIFDLNGSGVDGAPDLMRALEKQGIVVDAWLDLKDRSIKGPGITERTSFLIKGEKPSLGGLPIDNNPLSAAIVESLGKISEMENKARDLGVQQVPYRRFLLLIGYKLPRGGQAVDPSSSAYFHASGGSKPAAVKDKTDAPK